MSENRSSHRLQNAFGRKVAGARQDAKATGLGRLIIVVYAVFSLSALARSSFQILTDFSSAPLPYLLSAFSAVVYVVATVALAMPGRTWYRVALAAVGVELAGVLGVGAFSVLAPDLFPRHSVWSSFGADYGWVPLVLPMVGLWWLWRNRPPAGNP